MHPYPHLGAAHRAQYPRRAHCGQRRSGSRLRRPAGAGDLPRFPGSWCCGRAEWNHFRWLGGCVRDWGGSQRQPFREGCCSRRNNGGKRLRSIATGARACVAGSAVVSASACTCISLRRRFAQSSYGCGAGAAVHLGGRGKCGCGRMLMRCGRSGKPGVCRQGRSNVGQRRWVGRTRCLS